MDIRFNSKATKEIRKMAALADTGEMELIGHALGLYKRVQRTLLDPSKRLAIIDSQNQEIVEIVEIK